MLAIRIVSVAVFAALCAYTVALAVQDRSQHLMLSVATRLEFGHTVSRQMVKATAEQILTDYHSFGCRSELLDPGLSVVLVNLSGTNQVKDYGGWFREHSRALDYLAEMIRCMPVDGNAWLREAMVSNAIAEDVSTLKPKMAMARRLMPHEGQQVLARLAVWKRLSVLGLNSCEAMARADIHNALVFGGYRLKLSLGEPASPQFLLLLYSEVYKALVEKFSTLPQA
jgi:hypothetical protein